MRAPVGRFVGVVATIAAVLLLVAWSGAAAPALQAQTVGEGTADGGRTGYLVVWLHNTGSLPVEVDRVTWRSDALADSEVLVGSTDGAPEDARPFAPFAIPGGAQRAVVLAGTITCPLPGDVVTVATDPLTVHATPVAGPGRVRTFSMDAPGQGMERTLPCPAR
jgi:hypothetical protein